MECKMVKKKKVSSMVGVQDCTFSPTVYIDFDDLEEIEGLSVGDEVRVVLKGTIKSLDQRESYEKKGETTASICLKDFEAEIVENSNQFTALLNDEDE